MSKRPKLLPNIALRRFRQECQEEELSLECALASDRQENSTTPAAVWSHGDGAQQKTEKPQEAVG